MNAEERIKKLKDIIQSFPKCNLAVFQHLMVHLNRYVFYWKLLIIVVAFAKEFDASSLEKLSWSEL